jgi:tRNA-2-methylthio-N6-dimethylallyladenosine synthase
MVGFPGETDADFEDTMDIMERVNFSSAFMFVYSPREGTPAAIREDQIDGEVSKNRIMQMVAKQNERTALISKGYEGKTVRILCEDYDEKKDMYLGRDEYGRMGYFSSAENLIGKFVDIKVGKTVGISLYGEIVEVLK